ncbi:MAG: membrane protein [Ilumatobacter sp.]|jgi:membrane protein
MRSGLSVDRWPVLGSIVEVVGQTYTSWRKDRTLRLGAGLAFYALFTIVPFLALIAALAEELFGLVDLAGYLEDRLEQMGIVNAEGAGQSIATELSQRSVTSGLGIIGVGSLLFASSLVFLALVDAINTIWDVPVRKGLRNSVRRRLVSFLMVLVTGAALIVTLALSTVTGAVERLVPGSTEFVGTLSTLLGLLASASSLAVALTLLFRYVGSVRAAWLPAASSGVATALLMVVGAQGISWYLSNFGGSSLSGAFGAVLVLLSWVYYEAQILLGGVQLVKVLTTRQGLGPEASTDP